MNDRGIGVSSQESMALPNLSLALSFCLATDERMLLTEDGKQHVASENNHTYAVVMSLPTTHFNCINVQKCSF